MVDDQIHHHAKTALFRGPGKTTDQELTTAFTSADKDRDKALSPFEARHMPPIAAQFAKAKKEMKPFAEVLAAYIIEQEGDEAAATSEAN